MKSYGSVEPSPHKALPSSADVFTEVTCRVISVPVFKFPRFSLSPFSTNHTLAVSSASLTAYLDTFVGTCIVVDLSLAKVLVIRTRIVLGPVNFTFGDTFLRSAVLSASAVCVLDAAALVTSALVFPLGKLFVLAFLPSPPLLASFRIFPWDISDFVRLHCTTSPSITFLGLIL